MDQTCCRVSPSSLLRALVPLVPLSDGVNGAPAGSAKEPFPVFGTPNTPRFSANAKSTTLTRSELMGPRFLAFFRLSWNSPEETGGGGSGGGSGDGGGGDGRLFRPAGLAATEDSVLGCEEVADMLLPPSKMLSLQLLLAGLTESAGSAKATRRLDEVEDWLLSLLGAEAVIGCFSQFLLACATLSFPVSGREVISLCSSGMSSWAGAGRLKSPMQRPNRRVQRPTLSCAVSNMAVPPLELGQGGGVGRVGGWRCTGGSHYKSDAELGMQ